jgi:hypothetical protein
LTWFKVDDSLHSNSKVRKVAAKAPAALALWLIAGSWSSDKLTEGFIPDDDLPWLIPGAEELAAELVTGRLWKRVKGGHRFHDWLEFNPSAKQIEDERAAARERMRRLRSGEQRPRSPERADEPTANVRGLFGPSRTSFRSRGAPARASPPGEACPQHAGQSAANCAPCRSERLGAS